MVNLSQFQWYITDLGKISENRALGLVMSLIVYLGYHFTLHYPSFWCHHRYCEGPFIRPVSVFIFYRIVLPSRIFDIKLVEPVICILDGIISKYMYQDEISFRMPYTVYAWCVIINEIFNNTWVTIKFLVVETHWYKDTPAILTLVIVWYNTLISFLSGMFSQPGL